MVKKTQNYVYDNSLIRDILVLTRRTDKFFPDLVDEINHRNEIAHTDTKTHFNPNSFAILYEGGKETEKEK
jgi:hypothetical protein